LTIVILLILAMVWAVVLGPGLWRRYVQHHSGDSIGDFRRQLGILGRTSPQLVRPAHRLRTEEPASGVVPGATGLPVVPDGLWRETSPPGRGDTGERLGHGGNEPGAMSWAEGGVRRPDPYFRPEACKRRRDILVGLAAGFVLSGLLAAVPGLHLLAALTGVVGLALAGYVVLLVHLRNLALERQVKLRYLPEPIAHEPSIVVRRAASR